jgi:hypothetical protein
MLTANSPQQKSRSIAERLNLLAAEPLGRA